MDFLFFANSAVLGIGLAMDAFSVSLANGLHEPQMPRSRLCLVAGTYALFQWAMPLTGWFLVHTAAEKFSLVQPFIPWIAFLLLAWIGGKMLWEGITALKEPSDESSSVRPLTLSLLLVQGVATSIDALSVGFTIASYRFAEAMAATLIIGGITFFICLAGLKIGSKVGTIYSRHASILGGCILIGIGLEILITHLF